MKKALLTIAIVLGLGMTSFADSNGGGLFQRGTSDKEVYGTGWNNRTDPLLPALPQHGNTENANAPLGTGIALLTTLGAAYWVAKRREQK